MSLARKTDQDCGCSAGRNWSDIVAAETPKVFGEIWNDHLAFPVETEGDVKFGKSSPTLWFTDIMDGHTFSHAALTAFDDVSAHPVIRAKDVHKICIEHAKNNCDSVNAAMASRMIYMSSTRMTPAGHQAGNKPTIWIATPGAGKTGQVVDLMALYQEPINYATPRAADAKAVYQKFLTKYPELKDQIHLHLPRKEKVSKDEHACLKYDDLVENKNDDSRNLVANGRSPASWACSTCPHGLPDDEREKGVPACAFKVAMRASLKCRIIITTDAAIRENPYC